jgi:mannosyl-glycoprotein endo-beta-N-acetylglucosaminidase
MTNNISNAKSQQVIAEIASIVYKHHKVKNNVHYLTTKATVPAYESANGKTIGSLAMDESFNILKNEGEWYEINFGGSKGYVKNNNINTYLYAPSTDFLSYSFIVNGYGILAADSNVLSTPSVNGKTLLTMKKGEPIYIHTQFRSYYTATFGNKLGYIPKEFVQIQFASLIKYLMVNKDTRIYTFKSGKNFPIGSIGKGEVYQRIQVLANYHKIKLGSSKAL